MLHDAAQALDPLGDAEETRWSRTAPRSGSARPSSLLYTYGPGAIMDLPEFTIMPAGLDDWEPIWNRREGDPDRSSRRGCGTWCACTCGPQVDAAAPVPVAAEAERVRPTKAPTSASRRACSRSGCAAPDATTSAAVPVQLHQHPPVPHRPGAVHAQELPRTRWAAAGSTGRKRESPAVPAQHLLTCTNGHLDEFPYTLWVHRGGKCPKAELPDLKMRDANVGKSVGSTIICASCGATRGMDEAQGAVGRDKLPQRCRGRHPHLNAFDAECGARPAPIMMGASNLWFPSTQSIIVMPRTDAEEKEALADRLRVELGVEQVKQFGSQVDVIRALADGTEHRHVQPSPTTTLLAAVAEVLAPADSEEERQEKLAAWDPIELLVPEWRYLQKPSLFPQQQNASGLMVTEMQRGPSLHPHDRPCRRGQPDEEGQRRARVHPARRDGPRRTTWPAVWSS